MDPRHLTRNQAACSSQGVDLMKFTWPMAILIITILLVTFAGQWIVELI
jgi:hypothetical protein